MDVTITYTQKQHDIFFGGRLKKFNVVTKGRRSGFTLGVIQWLIQQCYERDITCLIVDVSHSMLSRYYDRYALPLLKKFPSDSWSYNIQRNELKIKNSIIDLRSADLPGNIEGLGYDIIVIQEAGIVMRDKYLYENAILPMLMDYENSMLIAGGTTKGKYHKGAEHPFFELFQKTNLDPENYAHFTMRPHDNPFISAKMVELISSTMDSRTKAQEIEGEFVSMVSGSPFLYAFDDSRHVIDSYTPNENLPLILSFDFNVSPMSAIIAQSVDVRTCIVFDEFVLHNSSTPELCAAVHKKYKKWIGRIMVTGDASGRARNAMVAGGITHYKIIKQQLFVRDYSFRVRKKNISHINSQMLCNSVLQQADFKITKNCKTVIADCLSAVVDTDGGGLKKTEEAGMHVLDCVRYLIDAAYPEFIDKPKKYAA